MTMTADEYWQAMLRFHTGTLSPQEEYHYRLAGLLGESAARAEGRSLLPYPWQQQEVAPAQLSKDLLIGLGLTLFVLGKDEPQRLPEQSN